MATQLAWSAKLRLDELEGWTATQDDVESDETGKLNENPTAAEITQLEETTGLRTRRAPQDAQADGHRETVAQRQSQ
jgi:hypothetical protein